MNFAYFFFLLALSLQRSPALQAGDASLGKRLEELAPRAAGVAWVEVVDTRRVDDRAGDGPLSLFVRFRILRGTGTTKEEIPIIQAQGGLPPENTPEWKPYGPVGVGTFEKGKRYWVAFSSQYDWKRCPQGVVSLWPERERPEILDEATRTDHYAHRPQYDPESGLTHSYRIAEDKSSWLVRMERDGVLLWEARLPGEKFQGDKYDGEWRLLQRRQWPNGLEHVEENHSGWYLLAETASRLETTNAYRLPAEKFRFTYALDADSGKTAATWVSRIDRNPTSSPSVVHDFDLHSGGLRREERYDFLENGGLAAGGKEERWLRMLVRTMDPTTGQLQDEKIYRWTESPAGSKYVPVDK